jgi:hypothetical protein
LLVIEYSFTPSFAFAPVHLGVQGKQPLLPQGPVPAQPFIDLGERLKAKTVDPPLRLLADLDKPRLPQHPQAPRYPRASNRQQRRQLTQNSFHAVTGPYSLCTRQGT